MADDEHLEQLSCLVDSELDDSRARFLTSRLLADEALQQRWRRYHVIGAALRSECRGGTVDLASRVATAIADDAAPTVARPASRFLRPVAGIAIAASVAISAYSLLAAGPASEPQPLIAAEEPVAERPTNANFDAAPGIPQRASVASGSQLRRPALTDPRVQAYLLRHNEAAVRRGQGLVPYLQMVTARTAAEQSNASVEDAPASD